MNHVPYTLFIWITVDMTALSVPAKPSDWAPRMWEGADFFAWLRLCARNRFAFGPAHLPLAGVISSVTFWHSVLRWLQHDRFGRDIARTRIAHAPVFILGHWRSGTTLLHELLMCDPRHNSPNTYQCFEPNHFLLTEAFVRKYLHFLAPKRRPMDNMAAGWDRPQEDEFALCMMGQPSPYLTIAFPNQPPAHPEYLDFVGVDARARQAWQRALVGFLRRLTFKDPRRLILKSPPHTARIRVLLEAFPDARFVHIVRNPYILYPSTLNLWKSLYRKQGMQTPNYVGLEEYVLNTFTRMYERFEADRHLIPAGRFYELRYEDLVQQPLAQLTQVYQQLELGTLPTTAVQTYLDAQKNYETNRYDLDAAMTATVGQRWAAIIERYGYAPPKV
jgi:hypothetical protein